LRDAKSRGVFFSLSGTLGERISATVSRSRQKDVQTTTMTLSRSVSYGGGFGWALQSVNNNGTPLRQAQGTYRQLRPGHGLHPADGGQRTTPPMWPARWC
jgi:outer membrane usher protein